jgi:hypothetical protein
MASTRSVRPGGAVAPCQWLGQCFGGNFCGVTRSAGTRLEKHLARALHRLSTYLEQVLQEGGEVAEFWEEAFTFCR